jgi:hypothetical protein
MVYDLKTFKQLIDKIGLLFKDLPTKGSKLFEKCYKVVEILIKKGH